MAEPECNHCGKCCQFVYKGVKYNCPYLKMDQDGKSSCEIYETRIGTIIFQAPDKTFVCGYRVQQNEKIDDCPYNDLLTNTPG